MKTDSLILFLLLTSFFLLACPPNNDNDDDANDDDATTDDDANDDDIIDDDCIDDDTTDDDTTDDDTTDDDTADDDTTDDDTTDDDNIDDDSADDDTGDDDTIPLVILKEHLLGGSSFSQDLALDQSGRAYLPIDQSALTWLFTIEGQTVTKELIGDHGQVIDIQTGPEDSIHVFFWSRIDQEYKHLWKTEGTWQSSSLPPETQNGTFSEFVVDVSNNLHFCLVEDAASIVYYTEHDGNWTSQTIYELPANALSTLNQCRLAVGGNGSVYIFFTENWWRDENYQRLWWSAFENNAWTIEAIDENAGLANLAIDNEGSVHATYIDKYGKWNGENWSWETIPLITRSTAGIWVIDGSPIILRFSSSSFLYRLYSVHKEDGEWSESLLREDIYSLGETIMDTQGNWHFLHRSEGVDYSTNRSGSWVDLTVQPTEPFIRGPLSQGHNPDNQLRFSFDLSNQGWWFLIRDGNQWLLERFPYTQNFYLAQFKTNIDGVTHVIGLDAELQQIVYAYENGNTWEFESTNILSTPIGYDLNDTGTPAFSSIAANKVRVSVRKPQGWQHLYVIETTDVNSGPTPVAIDDQDNLTVCYTLDVVEEVRCARRTGYFWSIDTIDSGGDEGAYSTMGLALDNNNYPHFVYGRTESSSQNEMRLAVFNGVSWETSKILDGNISLAWLLVDDVDAHHLVFIEWQRPYYTLGYATDACGFWQVIELDPGNIGELAPPIILPNGSIQIAYTIGYGLWRLILDPPNCEKTKR